MPDISLIELAFYGFVELFSIAMLIISTIKEVPVTRSLSLTRAIYLIPGMICAIILANSGVDITMNTTEVITLTYNETNDLIFTENATQNTNRVTLQNPVWVTFHYLVFAVLMIYLITQLLMLFTKTD